MRHVHPVPGVLVVGLVGLMGLGLAACNHDSTGGDGGADMGAGADGDLMGGGRDLRFDNDAFFIKDPPPQYCGLDGGMFTPPKPPGGTPDCPDDKNREGCPCPKAGVQAPCWPGARKNRHLGICQDGTTTCTQKDEVETAWGPCMGAVLPVAGGTGKQACECFSGGQWKIDDLVPCFYAFGAGNTNYGSGGTTSSTLQGGKIVCQDFGGGPVMTPASPWSTDSVRADCEGHFKLCYAIKAGDPKNPKPADCTIIEKCAEADYTQTDMVQPFPALPAFATDTPMTDACAVQFVKSGGYGEMRVDGTSITCDPVKKVFNRVTYCPLDCKPDGGPECQNCMNGGSGNF